MENKWIKFYDCLPPIDVGILVQMVPQIQMPADRRPIITKFTFRSWRLKDPIGVQDVPPGYIPEYWFLPSRSPLEDTGCCRHCTMKEDNG